MLQAARLFVLNGSAAHRHAVAFIVYQSASSLTRVKQVSYLAALISKAFTFLKYAALVCPAALFNHVDTTSATDVLLVALHFTIASAAWAYCSTLPVTLVFTADSYCRYFASDSL